jgi:hypothetical protein
MVKAKTRGDAIPEYTRETMGVLTYLWQFVHLDSGGEGQLGVEPRKPNLNQFLGIQRPMVVAVCGHAQQQHQKRISARPVHESM